MSTNNSHTPGPWKLILQNSLFYKVESNTITIAQGIQRHEDAKLIAAAPELLEAAVRLESYCNAVGGQFQFSQELKELSAAIRKATE